MIPKKISLLAWRVGSQVVILLPKHQTFVARHEDDGDVPAIHVRRAVGEPESPACLAFDAGTGGKLLDTGVRPECVDALDVVAGSLHCGHAPTENASKPGCGCHQPDRDVEAASRAIFELAASPGTRPFGAGAGSAID